MNYESEILMFLSTREGMRMLLKIARRLKVLKDFVFCEFMVAD